MEVRKRKERQHLNFTMAFVVVNELKKFKCEKEKGEILILNVYLCREIRLD